MNINNVLLGVKNELGNCNIAALFLYKIAIANHHPEYDKVHCTSNQTEKINHAGEVSLFLFGSQNADNDNLIS